MLNTAPERVIQVAVGVVVNTHGQVLLAWRDAHRHQGACWEFPGGKLEPGETVETALARELREELGIEVDVGALTPLMRIPWHYGDKTVCLHVRRVPVFAGTPHGREGQTLRWAQPDELRPEAFPAANRGIVRALQCPSQVFITPGLPDVEQGRQWLAQASKLGAGMVVLRPAAPYTPPTVSVVTALIDCARQLGLRCLVHGHCPHTTWSLADGVHFPASMLAQVRPDVTGWRGASCHSPEELERARQAGCDYAFLSPVCPTASHPQVRALGWVRFAQWVQDAAIPVYALGGVGPGDLNSAHQAGAQGVAGIRAYLGVA